MLTTATAELAYVTLPLGYACSLWRDGDNYVMMGPSGIHTLHIASTPDVRLWAHWRAFVQHNIESVA